MNGEVEKLASLVKEMRDAQRTYFRTRSGDALADAKRLERAVDAAVKAIGERWPMDNPGNPAVMREALSDACYAMFNFLKTQSGGCEEMAIALDKAKAALFAPAEETKAQKKEADNA